MSSQFVLQTTHQSLAHRLWRYAADGGTLFYPAGICEKAVEVGPHTDRDGPCIVLYLGCQLSPAQLNEWIAQSSSSSAAVVRAYWLGPSPQEAESHQDLVDALLAAGPPAGGGPLRLQCFPRSLEPWLADQLPAEWNLQPVAPQWVLNVVCMPVEEEGEQQQQQQQQENGCPGAHPQQEQAAAAGPEQPTAQQHAAAPAAPQQAEQDRSRRQRVLYSLQPAAELYNYAPVRTKRVPDQLSKAAGKLAEALQASGVQLTTGVAVDLGAAPGGWTHVLAQRAQRVIAVDPAEMDQRALAAPGVTHLACKAEDAVDTIRSMVGATGVDLLVSDVNKHPSQIIKMMRPLLPLLHPGAAIIMTLKFFGRSGGRQQGWQQQLAQELGPGFEGVRLLWLLANTQHEQTCIAFKAAAPAAA